MGTWHATRTDFTYKKTLIQGCIIVHASRYGGIIAPLEGDMLPNNEVVRKNETTACAAKNVYLAIKRSADFF